MTPDTDTNDTSSFMTTQRWNTYRPVDHEVWRILYERRMTKLESTASHAWLGGAEMIAMESASVPDLHQVNERLSRCTGWKAVPVRGFMPAPQFFGCLARRHFPTTVTVRPMDQLDYLPEPDIFHDVFGHVPLHADPAFADFLQGFGRAAAAAGNPDEVTQMARLFWFTVEFGLIREAGQTRIYGSGLISSEEDGTNALGDACTRQDFDLDTVIEQNFEIDRLQDVLFVAESFEQIVDAVEVMQGRLGHGS
jgi:phenylalanine-4-hydroxylase